MKLNTAKKIMTLNTKEAVKFVKENLNWLNDEEQMFEEATSGNWTNGEYTDEEVDEAIQTVDDNWVREMIEELNTENKEDKKMAKNTMTGHEKIAKKNITGAFNYLVGGWYNCFQDGCEEDIPELTEAMETVYDSAMNDDYRSAGCAHFGKAPKEMRFAGEEFCRSVVEKLFSTDGDAIELWGEDGVVENRTKEENTMKNTREEARATVAKWNIKELREHLKAAGVKGISKAKKDELVEMVLDLEEQKDAAKAGNTVEISKVKMYAFTGMYIGEFEAEVQDGKILVYTESKGELMFDLSTGKELCEESKARYANRVEAV